ncbi:MAG: RNA 2',3'-cyclic phosphodiesterase [Ignavibacteria bacterium]|nr:RNA 2',3'-cyclic phosphodiesterase [Ignavibacteria bacterium]
MKQSDSRRLFVAVDTPAQVKSRIAELQNQLKSTNADVRWDTLEKLHLTIKFLGSTRPDLVQPVITALGTIAAGTAPLKIVYRNLGHFPKRGDPRILWAGMEEETGALTLLHESIEQEMAALGFAKDDRRFHPHITIGRIRSARRIPFLLRTMETITFECQPVVVSSIDLINSELKPDGSVYSTIASFPLTG